MRIHSKFKDYYDTALGWGIDPNCHYVRETTEHHRPERTKGKTAGVFHTWTDSLDFDNLPTADWNTPKPFKTIKRYVVSFCGHRWFALRFEVEVKNRLEYRWCWNIEDLARLVDEFGTKKIKEKWLSGKPEKIYKWETERGFVGARFLFDQTWRC